MSEPLTSLNLREAINLTKRAIREKGWDYVYPHGHGGDQRDCYNFEEDGSPSCVVGHVLSYQGVTLQGLKMKDLEWEEQYDYPCEYNRTGITTMNGDIVQVDELTETFLNKLQYEQDQGQSWGRSYVAALQELYRYKRFYG